MIIPRPQVAEAGIHTSNIRIVAIWLVGITGALEKNVAGSSAKPHE